MYFVDENIQCLSFTQVCAVIRQNTEFVQLRLDAACVQFSQIQSFEQVNTFFVLILHVYVFFFFNFTLLTNDTPSHFEFVRTLRTLELKYN